MRHLKHLVVGLLSWGWFRILDTQIAWTAPPAWWLRMILVAGSVTVISWSVTKAWSHDIYSQVYEKNGLPGQSRLCCGGDEKRGDCEGLDSDRIHETPEGVFFLSKRYGAQVFVPKHRIHWDGPRTNGTMQLADPLNRPAHWCGRPRMDTDGAPNDDNPDPRFITFCAFMLPGGV